MLGRDPDDSDEWPPPGEAPGTDRSAAVVLAGRIAALSAAATGADGAIRVTVDGTGVLTGLELDEPVRRMAGPDLAEAILRVTRRAQAGLADQLAALVDGTVGADSPVGRGVLAEHARRFPPPDDPDDPAQPVMPSPPFLSFPEQPSFPSRPDFPHRPSVPHQPSGDRSRRTG